MLLLWLCCEVRKRLIPSKHDIIHLNLFWRFPVCIDATSRMTYVSSHMDELIVIAVMMGAIMLAIALLKLQEAFYPSQMMYAIQKIYILHLPT